MIKNLIKIALIYMLISSCVYAAQMYQPRVNVKDNDTVANHKSNITANILWDDTKSPVFIGK